MMAIIMKSNDKKKNVGEDVEKEVSLFSTDGIINLSSY